MRQDVETSRADQDTEQDEQSDTRQAGSSAKFICRQANKEEAAQGDQYEVEFHLRR
jgi:hypothetical protein